MFFTQEQLNKLGYEPSVPRYTAEERAVRKAKGFVPQTAQVDWVRADEQTWCVVFKHQSNKVEVSFDGKEYTRIVLNENGHCDSWKTFQIKKYRMV